MVVVVMVIRRRIGASPVKFTLLPSAQWGFHIHNIIQSFHSPTDFLDCEEISKSLPSINTGGGGGSNQDKSRTNPSKMKNKKKIDRQFVKDIAVSNTNSPGGLQENINISIYMCVCMSCHKHKTPAEC